MMDIDSNTLYKFQRITTLEEIFLKTVDSRNGYISSYSGDPLQLGASLVVFFSFFFFRV